MVALKGERWTSVDMYERHLGLRSKCDRRRTKVQGVAVGSQTKLWVWRAVNNRLIDYAKRKQKKMSEEEQQAICGQALWLEIGNSATRSNPLARKALLIAPQNPRHLLATSSFLC